MGIGFGAVPLLIFFVIPGAFAVWFSLTMIKLQKEKVELLKGIAEKLADKPA